MILVCDSTIHTSGSKTSTMNPKHCAWSSKNLRQLCLALFLCSMTKLSIISNAVTVAAAKFRVYNTILSKSMHTVQLVKADLFAVEDIDKVSKTMCLHSCPELIAADVFHNNIIFCVSAYHSQQHRLNMDVL